MEFWLSKSMQWKIIVIKINVVLYLLYWRDIHNVVLQMQVIIEQLQQNRILPHSIYTCISIPISVHANIHIQIIFWKSYSLNTLRVTIFVCQNSCNSFIFFSCYYCIMQCILILLNFYFKIFFIIKNECIYTLEGKKGYFLGRSFTIFTRHGLQ